MRKYGEACVYSIQEIMTVDQETSGKHAGCNVDIIDDCNVNN